MIKYKFFSLDEGKLQSRVFKLADSYFDEFNSESEASTFIDIENWELVIDEFRTFRKQEAPNLLLLPVWKK